MKKILLFTFILFLFSCDNRTPEQKAKEKYEADKQRTKEKRMQKEVYIDSVLNVAAGVGKYQYLRENRLNALKILKKEYPDMVQKWDSIESSIYN